MKKIILLLLAVLIITAAFRSNEKITITGNVKDENGNALVATIKGGNSLVTADSNGNYQITVNENEKYLFFLPLVTLPGRQKSISKKLLI